MVMFLKRLAVAVACLALSGCGFKPIYATPENGGAASLNQAISVRQISAPEAVAPYINDALERRLTLREGRPPKYDLYVQARESAERLAVQIDATVTRFNYRLRAAYTLVDLENGERFSGSANAVASYNIVTSQYSTLFAERTAQEKAAQILAEEIERDLLIRFSEPSRDDMPERGLPIEIDPETNLIVNDLAPVDTIPERTE